MLSTDSFILLLTATINPGNTPFVRRANPDVRARDYITAVSWWRDRLSNSRIVFCENSQTCLAERYPAFAEQRPPIQVIGSTGDEIAKRRGKGYCELKLIADALEALELHDDCKILKATGRYIVHNIDAILAQIERTTNYEVWSCDFWSEGPPAISTEIFCATKRFLDAYLLPEVENINDSKNLFIEHAFAAAAIKCKSDGGEHHFFRPQPHLLGISGTFNVPVGICRTTDGIKIPLTADYARALLFFLGGWETHDNLRYGSFPSELVQRLQNIPEYSIDFVSLKSTELLMLLESIDRCVGTMREEDAPLGAGISVDAAKHLLKDLKSWT